MELKDLLKIDFQLVGKGNGKTTKTDAEVVAEVYSLTAAAGLHLGTAAIQAAIYQDDDAHDTCTLTACLNPLHPGPCKGWKGTLHSVSPGAWHTLEAARVEKANTARIKKIEALKAQGKPIPHKLLQPILPKASPHAGKTAQGATGEAHAAGKAVSDAAGVHVQTPGKVTLGQAVKQIKATDATPEKGPKGKKPTVASKGIAAVIAQEKVTPQYKLDKAAKITPEQWNGLSGDEKSIIRGELVKIQKDGFGPQQKKATELLDQLPAQGLKGGGTDTVTTPKGQVVQKISLKEIENGPEPKAPSPVKAPEAPAAAPKAPEAPAPAPEAPAPKLGAEIPKNATPLATQKLLKKIGAADITVSPGTSAEATFKDVGLPGGDHQHQLINEGAGNWHITDKDGKKLKFVSKQQPLYLAKSSGPGEADKPEAPKTPTVKEMHEPNNPTPAGQAQAKPENVKKAVEKAAKDAAAAKVAAKHEPGAVKVTPAAEVKPPASADLHTPKVPGEPLSAKNYTPAMKAATEAAAAYANPPKIIALQTPFKDRLKAYNKLGAEEWKALPDGTKTTIVKDMIEAVAADQQLHQGFIGDDGKAYTPVSAWMIRRNIQVPALDQGKIDKFVPQFAKDKPTKPAPVVQIPEKTIVESSNIFGEYSQVTSVLHPKYGQTPVQTPVQTPKLSEIATPNTAIQTSKPPTPAAEAKLTAPPKHIQTAIDMANGTAPGASWSKNHLAAYEKLTPEEFQALPPDIQAKVVQELKKGATKFLDPKKITATKELLAKFDTGKPAPKAPSGEVGFQSHLTDHNVSDLQAKKAAAGQPTASHAAVAKELAGLDLADQPDVMAHHNAAMQYSKDLVATFTKDEPSAALKDPAVQQGMENVAAAAYALKQAQLIGTAKKNAFNKIDKLVKGDQGQLSPMQKASLAEYQKYLLDHPANTEPEQIVKLQQDVLAATDDLRDKLKAAKAPKAVDMTPAQLDAKVSELLGPDAAKPQVNLSMAELKEANATGKHMAALSTEKYSKATLENPEVAAKMKQVELVAGQLAATAENKKKLQEHLKKYHFKALNEHLVGNGTLSDADAKVVEAHALKIKNDHAYLDTVINQQQDKLIQVRKAFDDAANAVATISDAYGNNWGKQASVTLSDYDVATISDAYGNNWGKQASKAVLYGVKTWSQKSEMKAHPEYAPFTQDLGNLQTAVKNLALAHATKHTAELNVPTDPDTGAKLPGPEKTAYLQAAVALDDAQQAYEKLYKVAQTRLDKIRTDVGLKKRALPKIDSPAVKAAAAESAYYKTGGYSGPNYGKQAAAKSYTLAKVGPKLGIKHQSASEKKAEKAASEAEKLKAAHPEFYAKKEADKATNAAKAAVSNTDAGKTPNAAAAEKFGWNYVPQVAPTLGQWDFGKDGAYYANEEHLKQAQEVLTGPDIQHGLAAQKQFKWSINNMETKGGSSAAKKSLYSYTGSGYDTVNTKLNSLPPGVEKTGSATITNIDNGMAASPPMEADAVLYRGFKDPKTVFSSGKWNDTNVAGMEWSQRSYSSTSGALFIAQSFAGYGGVVMRVIIPKGMKVHGINAKGGQHGGENEIILQRGLRYRVVADYGKHGSDGKRYIDVMVVPNPYAKAE